MLNGASVILEVSHSYIKLFFSRYHKSLTVTFFSGEGYWVVICAVFVGFGTGITVRFRDSINCPYVIKSLS